MGLPVNASFRDRTNEFRSIAERLAKAQGVAPPPGPAGLGGGLEARGGGAGGTGQQSEFARKASRIGLGIHSTSAKLARLAQLAKRTSMFDDPAAEINELTSVIKQDIGALNKAISEMQALSARGTGGNKHTNDHAMTVVDNLKSRLMGTTKEFKDVLEIRTENLKGQQQRRSMFSNDAPGAAAPASNSPSASLIRRGGPGSGGGAAVAPAFIGARAAPAFQGSAGGGEGAAGGRFSQPPGPPSFGAQSQALMPAQDTYMSSRAEALHNVESTIVELSGIFNQLATMVAEQGEMAVRIDENVDDTLANVESAQGHLLKYLNRINSNRWLIMKIFFTLMVFLVIFVVFVA